MVLTAVLLAGGESRRLGRDKATADWRGQPLWQRQIETLRALHPQEILLSARSDPAWRPSEVRLVLDDSPSRGPLSGLTAALTSTRTEHLLALAVDMPFMTVEHLQNLCALASSGKGVIPTIDGRAEPLSAIYPIEARSVFLETLQSENFSLQPIVAKLISLKILQVMPISGPARDLYMNINEPHELD
jgi:molybdopterin-guanine dinucleotide biosynthesis protein A